MLMLVEYKILEKVSDLEFIFILMLCMESVNIGYGRGYFVYILDYYNNNRSTQGVLSKT